MESLQAHTLTPLRLVFAVCIYIQSDHILVLVLIKPVVMVTVTYLGYTVLIFTLRNYLVKDFGANFHRCGKALRQVLLLESVS